MSEYILDLKKISKSFSGVEVLHEVSFSLRPGEVHALLGENGAGKSTLVKVITGVHHPDSGEIYLNDAPVQFSDTHESRQAGIAAIYQELSLFPDLDVAENIFVGRQPVAWSGRVDWHKLYAEAEKLLKSLGVHLDLKQKTRSLSIAQQQMVEIARAFSINARILIMDEPTSSLTLSEVADLFRLVRRLRGEGTAIIFISHRLEELFELADRVTVLRDGSYVDTRLMKDVTRDDLIRMMVGRTITNLFPKQNVEAGEVVLKVEELSRAGADGGQIAVLSATSTAPNQNGWIEVMKEELKKPEYSKLELVEVVYGDDDDTKSYNEAQALFTKYPDLKVIIAPTTVGIAASARAVTDADLIGKVFVTGLGTPNQMREYVKSGAAPQFALWNPADLGYLAVYAMHALATGEIKGAAGDKFTAGRLGDYTVQDDPDLGLNVLLGLPFIWDKNNIDDSNW